MIKMLDQIADLCKKARIRAGHTQSHVAHVAECSVSMISMYESGKRNNAELFAIYLILYPDLMQGVKITEVLYGV